MSVDSSKKKSPLTNEQKLIVETAENSIVVLACPGSGKTYTAVRRLIEVRNRIKSSGGFTTLLSFSNVAVDTFRHQLTDLTIQLNDASKLVRISVETIDGFLTKNIVRHHAYRTMNCKRVPFLLNGNEQFLSDEKYLLEYEDEKGSLKRILPDSITIGHKGGVFTFECRKGDQNFSIIEAEKKITNLGELGAYTHALGNYWAYRTLLAEPQLLKAIVRRYPHVIIDEAQDISEIHGLIVDLWIQNGMDVSLIGDLAQSIYEFNGASGDFLNNFSSKYKAKRYHLSVNFRSVKKIVDFSNSLSNSQHSAFHKDENSIFGVYYTIYDESSEYQAMEAFKHLVERAAIKKKSSRIMCRRIATLNRIQGIHLPWSAVRSFALAAIQRDKYENLFEAFSLLVPCLLSLFDNVPVGTDTKIRGTPSTDLEKKLRKEIWSFLKDGLPSASLRAKKEWFNNLDTALDKFTLNAKKNLGMSLNNKYRASIERSDLSYLPLVQEANPREDFWNFSTVHKSKGESIDAVLYITDLEELKSFLHGPKSEEGKIGYVALTRAKFLFCIAVPKGCDAEISKLEKMGARKLTGHTSEAS